MRVNDIPEIARLSRPVEYTGKDLVGEDLWDSIVLDESNMPVPQSHKEELDRRQQSYALDPGNLLSLEELQGRIESRK